MVAKALSSNWIAPLGPDVDAFEREFQTAAGTGPALAVNSGTSALHLALALLGVSSGDEVFCSSFTFIASAGPITYLGAKPLFIDSEPQTWNMDPNLLEQALKDRARRGKLPKAVIVVHLYGQSADMSTILSLCNTYDVPVIEDAAQALGALYKDQPLGSMGLIGTFSFNSNKIITTSSGGMLVTKNADLNARARYLASQARTPALHYQHEEVGFNFRMSNILAALGRAQLKALKQKVTAKRAIFKHYHQRLAQCPGLTFMPETPGGKSNRWLTCLLLDPKKFGADYLLVQKNLAQAGIESRPLCKPLHLQPAFSGCSTFGGAFSEHLFAQGLCLPSGTSLGEEDIAEICEIFLGSRQ